jgi:signal peptidase I
MTEPIQETVATEAPTREPWRAANLSMMLPGLGQWEAGERMPALLFGSGSALLWILSLTFLLVPRLPGWVGTIGVFAWVALFAASIVDAHRRVRDANAPEQEEMRTSSRDAWKTVFLNRLVPGLGHAYEGRWGGAVAWFLGFLLALALPRPLGALAAAAVFGGAVWRGWSRTRARAVSDRTLLLAMVAAATVWTAAGLAVPDWLRENYFQAFRIPSPSMSPTLQVGDHVFVDKRPFVPRDGDLVVYPFPDNPSQLFLKRVLALPGELVEFKADGAYRDGQRVLAGPTGGPPPVGAELLGSEGHPYRVPEGQAFLVGDNLESSNDSRHHGPIPIARLRGRAFKTYWPPGRAHSFP